MCDRYAAEYEGFIRDRMAAAGLGAPQGRFAQSLDLMLGKKQIYLQQPRYYYFPELPQIQFYDRSTFPWLDRLEAATDAIRGELLAVLEEEGAFKPYIEYDPARPPADYAGLLGNPDWSAWYLWRDGAPVPDHAARCPKTLEALADAPLARTEGRTPSIMVSLLRPGAHIAPHNGFINTRLICHLPLIAPPGCRFRVGNDERRWEEGRAWVFDDTIEHEAWNDSDQTRVILLFDIWRPELSEEERAFVSAMLQAVDAYGGERRAWDA
jgi:aspartyl/asparaginyl beta-hydroxylase (cupin superfamily)